MKDIFLFVHIHAGLMLISSLMIMASLAMFTFPKNLKGNRIPAPMKMRAIEEAKKLEKRDEDAKPRLKGNYKCTSDRFWNSKFIIADIVLY